MSLKKGFLRLTVVLSTLLPCIAIIHILAMPTIYSFEFQTLVDHFVRYVVKPRWLSNNMGHCLDY